MKNLTHKQLYALAHKLKACEDAQAWIKETGYNLQTAWARCTRADWMLWWLAHTDYPRPKLVKLTCQCARTALQYVPQGEDRPRLAIEAAEKWADDPTEENRTAVYAAANAAYAAAYAAAIAADFTDAAVYAAAHAAAHAAIAAAAHDVALAAGNAADAAANAAVHAAALIDMADMIRQATGEGE